MATIIKFLNWLGAFLIAFKLFGIVDLSWGLILSPYWIPLFCATIMYKFSYLLFLIQHGKDSMYHGEDFLHLSILKFGGTFDYIEKNGITRRDIEKFPEK